MKKISYIFLLTLITLASCSQSNNVENTTNTNSGDLNNETGTSELDSDGDEVLNSNIEMSETSTGETTSTGEISNTGSESSTGTESSTDGAEKVNFNAGYTIPNGMNVAMTGYLEVKDGVIVGVGGMEGAQGPQEFFAKGVGEKVIGKEIKGLQIDTISGASLTSAAFNKFLKDNYN